MAQILPKWTNKLPAILAAGVLVAGSSVVGGIWYYGSPKYLNVGYRPDQPVEYSHKLHAGDLGMDCRYCHTTVETSPRANVPPTSTCMNCHKVVRADSEKLALVRDSHDSKKPIEWIKVHQLPGYAYFNHGSHINAGVGCVSCHGKVNEMEVVAIVEPMSMGWCLDCHRQPESYLRPLDQVTNMQWVPPANQSEIGLQMIIDRNLKPPKDCSGCHR